MAVGLGKASAAAAAADGGGGMALVNVQLKMARCVARAAFDLRRLMRCLVLRALLRHGAEAVRRGGEGGALTINSI